MTKSNDALAALIRQVDGKHTLGAAELAEAIINAGWQPPIPKPRYVQIGAGDGAAVGDLVTSKWSKTGAVWKVLEVGPEHNYFGRVTRRLKLVSITSQRFDERNASELVRVSPEGTT